MTSKTGSKVIDRIGKYFPVIAGILAVFRLFYLYAILMVPCIIGFFIAWLIIKDKEEKSGEIQENRYLKMFLLGAILQGILVCLVPDLWFLTKYMIVFPIQTFFNLFNIDITLPPFHN